jgi:hypothetical protein
VELRRTAPFRRRLRFGGINSAWLHAMQLKLRPQVPLERVWIQLSAEELRVLRMLEQAVGLERLLGPSAGACSATASRSSLKGLPTQSCSGTTADDGHFSYCDARLLGSGARGRVLEPRAEAEELRRMARRSAVTHSSSKHGMRSSRRTTCSRTP